MDEQNLKVSSSCKVAIDEIQQLSVQRSQTEETQRDPLYNKADVLLRKFSKRFGKSSVVHPLETNSHD
jgi:hypothetical protein